MWGWDGSMLGCIDYHKGKSLLMDSRDPPGIYS